MKRDINMSGVNLRSNRMFSEVGFGLVWLSIVNETEKETRLDKEQSYQIDAYHFTTSSNKYKICKVRLSSEI